MQIRQLAIELFIVVVVGAALGLLGPFGSYALPDAIRLAYWIGFGVVGYAVYRPIQMVAFWLAETTIIPIWVALLLAAAIAALPLTGLIGFALAGMQYSDSYLGAGFPILYFQVFGIGLGFQFFMRLLFADRESIDGVAAEAPSPMVPLDINAIPLPTRPDVPLLKRLQPELGDHLVCLEMQDHYVKVHMLAGSTMLLMRLRDAIAELGGVEGQQVHRSWWVARDEVRAIRRQGRAVKLELTNGLLAPVARNRQEALKREGWL